MSSFDKVCAGAAFLLGAVFLALGAVGVFIGSAAHFTLPPVLGILPAFVGWGIVRSVLIAWKVPRLEESPEPEDESAFF